MAADYDTKVYVEVGGDKLVVADGGEIELQSGATFDVQSGANFDLGSFGTSMVVTQTDNYPMGVFGTISTAQTTGSVTQRGIWARMDVDANLSGTASVMGAELQFRFDGATSIGSGVEAEQYTGAWLYFEQDTSGDTLADYCHASASFASVETHSDLGLSANTHLSGIEIASRLGASDGVAWADTTGTTAALFITKAPAATGVTASDWPYGIVIENCTTGINLAGCTGIGSNIILGGYGRISTSTYAGAALAITDTFTEDSGLYLRYAVASMTGTIFYGAWIRAETSADISTKRLTGLEVYGTSAYTCGELRAIQSYAYVKDGTATETVGPIYGVSAELTFDAGTATKTITTEAMPLRVRITGGKVDTYTKIHGIQLMAGDMNGASPTYGYAIEIKDGPETGTVTWTTGLRITSPCTTGIDLGDNCTTAIDIGDCTRGIDFTGTEGSGTGEANICMDILRGADFSLGIYLYGSTDKSIYVAQYMTAADTKPVEFYGMPTSLTEESSQGVLQINITRDAAYAMSATTGNPDTLLRLRGKNEANNTVARGGLRGIDLEVVNSEASSINSYLHAATFTAENTSEINTQCDDMQVLQLNMSNQGIVDSTLYGLRVLEKSEGTIPTDTVGIKVTTATTAPASGTRADGVMITTGGATGGWTDGLHIAGTITNAINISGTTIGTAIVIAGTCTKALTADSITCASGAYGASIKSTLDDGASDGAALYLETHLTGTPSGTCIGFGSWINIDEAHSGTGRGVRAGDFGIYGVGYDLTGYSLYGLNIGIHADAANAPANIAMIRFNCIQSGATPTYLFEGANPEAMAYQANTVHTAANTDKAGAIKIKIGGAKYIYVYDHPGQ